MAIEPLLYKSRPYKEIFMKCVQLEKKNSIQRQNFIKFKLNVDVTRGLTVYIIIFLEPIEYRTSICCIYFVNNQLDYRFTNTAMNNVKH